MGFLSGLAPWIVYWALVGNVPFRIAAVAGLAVAVAALVVARRRRGPGLSLEIGSVATFLVITVVTFTVGRVVLERWLQPLGTAGLLVIALVGLSVGRPFVRQVVEADLPKEVVDGETFAAATTRITWIWVAAFAGMTVSSAIPPIARDDASVLDATAPLAFVCYWVVPMLLLAAAVLAGRVVGDRMVAEATSPHVVRRSTFVAFKELAIDELFYLAKEKADREVGAGMEAYAVQVGGKGVPLTGDESRESWGVTYKVRERR